MSHGRDGHCRTCRLPARPQAFRAALAGGPAPSPAPRGLPWLCLCPSPPQPLLHSGLVVPVCRPPHLPGSLLLGSQGQVSAQGYPDSCPARCPGLSLAPRQPLTPGVWPFVASTAFLPWPLASFPAASTQPSPVAPAPCPRGSGMGDRQSPGTCVSLPLPHPSLDGAQTSLPPLLEPPPRRDCLIQVL